MVVHYLLGGRLEAPLMRTRRVGGLAKAEAEDLLDWLEANGYERRDVAYKEGKGFVVQYQCAAWE
jgi:hypothetical protein